VNIYATKVAGIELDPCVKGLVFVSGCDGETWVNDIPHKGEVLVVVMCAREAISGSSGGITNPSV
jgi:hypothetical protein